MRVHKYHNDIFTTYRCQIECDVAFLNGLASKSHSHFLSTGHNSSRFVFDILALEYNGHINFVLDLLITLVILYDVLAKMLFKATREQKICRYKKQMNIYDYKFVTFNQAYVQGKAKINVFVILVFWRHVYIVSLETALSRKKTRKLCKFCCSYYS